MLDDEVVPLWDFKLMPKTKFGRDSSAAAVAVCGLQELIALKVADKPFVTAVQKILLRLCSNDYLDQSDSCPGLLRNAQIGSLDGIAINGYSSWGDYFLMESLNRELGISAGDTFGNQPNHLPQ